MDEAGGLGSAGEGCRLPCPARGELDFDGVEGLDPDAGGVAVDDRGPPAAIRAEHVHLQRPLDGVG
ncbi:hypothetical protein WMF11_34205 [Sorangium sp. So ce295]|uniref:hypothetical protein n=1 Tax=Sorangium sp. So ce295 TaxID=3133295 RepID=UPI003F613E73